MKRIIYKHPLTLRVGEIQQLPLPAGSEILTARMQYAQLVVWTLEPIKSNESDDGVISNTVYEIHEFVIFYTGDEVELEGCTLDHITTIQSGVIVAHLFKIIRT